MRTIMTEQRSALEGFWTADAAYQAALETADRLKADRDEAVRVLVEECGLSVRGAAVQLGLSSSRVQQILDRARGR